MALFLECCTSHRKDFLPWESGGSLPAGNRCPLTPGRLSREGSLKYFPALRFGFSLAGWPNLMGWDPRG
jgi:hypothetical protein